MAYIYFLSLQGHTKKVTLIEWHPTAASILLSAAMDLQCILWNTATAAPLSVIAAHRDVIYTLGWNRDGSLFVTSCKDKQLRVIDPRTGSVVAVCTLYPCRSSLCLSAGCSLAAWCMVMRNCNA